MKKFRSLNLTLILFILSWETLAQPEGIRNIEYFDINKDFFNKKELSDLEPSKIIVTKRIYRYDKSFRIDTIYRAFLRKGNIEEEFITYPSIPPESMHVLYNYKGNRLASKKWVNVDTEKDTTIGIELFDKNENKIQKEIIWNGRPLSITQYSYDSRNRINSIEYPNRQLQYKYYNDSIGQLDKMVEIEISDGKIDSIINKYLYDFNGNVIKKSHVPSDTYLKTFDIDCITGFGTRYLSYDSLNRLTSIGNKVSGSGYEEFVYVDYGILVESYNSKHIKQSSNLYFNCRILDKQMEVYFLSNKTTFYLHEESNLPRRIVISTDGLSLYEFEYIK